MFSEATLTNCGEEQVKPAFLTTFGAKRLCTFLRSFFFSIFFFFLDFANEGSDWWIYTICFILLLLLLFGRLICVVLS